MTVQRIWNTPKWADLAHHINASRFDTYHWKFTKDSKHTAGNFLQHCEIQILPLAKWLQCWLATSGMWLQCCWLPALTTCHWPSINNTPYDECVCATRERACISDNLREHLQPPEPMASQASRCSGMQAGNNVRMLRVTTSVSHCFRTVQS